jgi:hypothetical protein
MRHTTQLMLITLFLAAYPSHATAQLPTAEAEGGHDKIANQYICVFDGNVTRGEARAEAHRAANPEMGQVLHVYQNTIRGFAVRLPAEVSGKTSTAIQRLRKNNPKIAYCEQDGTSKAALQRRPGSGGITEQPSWGVTRVNGGKASSSRTAWIIDSGIDLDHPDLRVDVGRSRSFLTTTSSADDAYGHGTHVAGIVAALDNEIGVVGVAPGSAVVALRVLDRRGSGPDSGVIAAVDHVAGAANSGDVVNMSLITTKLQAMNDAVQRASEQKLADGSSKILYFTLAAGNSAANASNYSPASTDGPYIYTVSAFSNPGDSWATFSNYGAPLDYSQPGVSIRSTDKGGSYSTKSGTSMAAPHLAGILLLAQPGEDGTVNGDPDGTADKIAVLPQ